MSSVEFQGGIEGVQAKKDTVEFKIIAANLSASDSALLAWLNEAQRLGTLLTLSVTADEADEDAEHQMRLFEDLITEQSMQQSARQVVGGVVAEFKRTGRRRSAPSAPVSDPAEMTFTGGDDPLEYGSLGEGATEPEDTEPE